MNALISTLLASCTVAIGADPQQLRVPPEFEVHIVAGPNLANDVYCMTISDRGDIIVSGRGYVRNILDTQTAQDMVLGIKDGPMGLLCEGTTLHVVVDGGVWRYELNGTSPVPKSSARKILSIKTGGEHDSHAIRRGPDGKLYLLCGNNSGVSEKTITSSHSPIRSPVAGVLLRMNDIGEDVEVFADGFRNPYDFDFDLKGDPHTFDSDNERCVGLPWYESTRFYRVFPGSNFGWLNPQFAQTWRMPPYFPDVAKPLAEVGRGSPTGCICYRHTQFPVQYHGGFFLADWTFGKIWFVAPNKKPEIFLEPIGDSGFAPTALAVHPKTGDLYVSIGGRGTRGGVYRITPKVKNPNAKPIPIQPILIKSLPQIPKHILIVDYHDMESVRYLQRELGDLVAPDAIGTVWEGYTFRKAVPQDIRKYVLPKLREAYPSLDANLNRELTRTLAGLADSDSVTLVKVANRLTSSSAPIDDIHHLIVLGRLTATRTETTTTAIASALVKLDEKFDKARIARDRHWPLRMSETATALLKLDPKLEDAILKHPDFGQASHAWLAKLLDRKRSARRILEQAQSTANYEWSPAIVQILTDLNDDELRPWIPKIKMHGGMTEALLPIVSRNVHKDDRDLYLSGLQSFQPRTIATAAKAIAQLPADDRDLLHAILALRRLGDSKGDTKGMTKDEVEAKSALVAFLKSRTGEERTTAKDWESWLSKTKPALAKSLATGGFDAAAWKQRQEQIPWDSGEATKGRAIFTKANCATCHNGAQAIGPSLEGVAKRFSRDDLLIAIVDPNRDVPARYRTTEVQTRDGRTHRGVIIYEAVDGIILHTGTTETVRIAGDNIESKQTRDLSLMPVGLLDPFSDHEIADLFAYLKTLQPAK